MTTKLATTTFETDFTNLPDGMTPADGFLVELFMQGNESPQASVTVPDSASHATFVISEPGTYFVAVSKMATDGAVIGSASSAPFSLEQDQVEVPVSVTVSLSPAVATPKAVKVSVK